MSGGPQDSRSEDPRDVDLEFARLLESEGVLLPPGQAPREPAARGEDRHHPHSPDSPSEPPSEEDRAKARAAHPSRGRGPMPPRELEDEEDIDALAPDAWMGDFVPPDPDLPEPTPRALWSWTALIGGLAALLVVAVVPALPPWIGGLGGLVALGGVIALLLRAPTHREGDGVQV
ncbi:hypothetical protein [Brachybacterium epidermidis]|uniref:hypothetical protein n=1 Tax=Brachybacterium epidermidis TaxID=2781983 RepID=UPI00398F1433